MPIQSIHITHFRNVIEAKIECASHFNIFFGENGAGKTSILEAIYYLSQSKSFRTSQLDRLIHENADNFVVFTQLLQDTVLIPIGIQRSRTASAAHVNYTPVKSVADITRHLPILFIGSDSHRILTDGPKVRRQFLDWGLFYTNAEFFTIWKQFNKTLHHRNAALKARAPFDEIAVWNQQFASLAESIHQLRKNYLVSFLPFFNEIISAFLDSVQITLVYSPGWDDTRSLLSALGDNYFRELHIGHTLFGPHRADLLVLINNTPAFDILSQGQQKLVSYALRLAQGLHFQSVTQQSPIYLIDDLPSELDSHKRKMVTAILSKIDAQVFITGIEQADLGEIMAKNGQNKMFHVKHGGVLSHAVEKCFT